MLLSQDLYIEMFLKAIERTVALSEKERQDIIAVSEIHSYSKHDMIIRQGGRYDNEIFVLEGIIRGYYDTYNQKEVNVEFFQGPSVTAPWFTRTFNHFSSINYQALTSVTTLEINAEHFDRLMKMSVAVNKWATGITQAELMRKTQREILLLTKNAEERFAVFRQMFTSLENHIPLSHIASYLGITQVSLSRLRSKK